MKNIEVVETLEPQGDLNEGFPDETFLEKLLILLLGQYLLVEVSIVGKLHHYA